MPGAAHALLEALSQTPDDPAGALCALLGPRRAGQRTGAHATAAQPTSFSVASEEKKLAQEAAEGGDESPQQPDSVCVFVYPQFTIRRPPNAENFLTSTDVPTWLEVFTFSLANSAA